MAYYYVIVLIISFLSALEIKASNILHKDPPPNQPYRTAYHFQPPKNWMNGPMIYKGIYHLFYQYNPQGPVWGNLVWAHSTSEDLVNWTPQPIALHPTSQQSDINGCWSGSTTILPGERPAILYTGRNQQSHEVQNLAIPKNLSDPYLIEWIKSPNNPLMAPNLENKINPSSFRDPSTSWLGHDGLWRVIIGNEYERRGTALLYRSKDFVQWTKAKEPLFSTEGTGMWECPDFYPRAIPRKVWLDKSGKQLMQWPIREIEKLRTDKVSPLCTMLKGGSVLEVSGVTASQADIEISFEISKFTHAEKLDPTWTDPGAICSLKGASAVDGLGPFGLLVLASKNIQEYTAVFFRIFKRQIRCAYVPSSLHLDYDKPIYGAFLDVDPMKEKLSLRTLIDHSIVESFGGEGKACITARVYPSLAIDEEAHLYAFNNGTENINISELAAWSMNKAQMNNRLVQVS
ncbi:Beta-fructofuranosidase [Handroanthus impetiginosus]|uniref:Beta-fructofuranosidase n=1 Tax=Handroanthus impetiginosus TaxID=429701 RepID=A0A2G9GFI6_9LAMI|nr:Beta-fructofuranosidase [Handroanthus impetiginosus]